MCLTENVQHFMDQNAKLRSITKQMRMSDMQDQEQVLQEQQKQEQEEKQKQKDRVKVQEQGEESMEEECCCCKTFVRGMSKINQEILQLKEIIKPNISPIISETVNSNSTMLNSTTTIVNDFQSSVNSQNSKGTENNISDHTMDDSQNSSEDTAIVNEELTELRKFKHEEFLEKNPNWNRKKFKWEEHSSGAARKVIERMGYKGKGLGKNEDGIEEAITVHNTTRKAKSLIFSSSIKRGIHTNRFNKKLKNTVAKFHKFNGKKAHHIKDYIQTHIDEEQPDSVVIVAGGNDVPIGKYNSMALSSIVDDIIQAGSLCRRNGVKNVHISSILPRSAFYFQLRRYELNNLLKERCRVEGFNFIDNKNIVLSDHIGHDGVHLNKAGTYVLCSNLWNCLNDSKV